MTAASDKATAQRKSSTSVAVGGHIYLKLMKDSLLGNLNLARFIFRSVFILAYTNSICSKVLIPCHEEWSHYFNFRKIIFSPDDSS